MNIEDIRHLTPSVENCAYYAAGGLSPQPQPVVEEVVRCLRFQNQGPALPWVSQEMKRLVEETRTRVASSLNAELSEVMLNENATTGINIVASGIDWRAGDNIVLSDHEHVGNRLPWYEIATRFGVELKFLRVTNHRERLLQRFEALIDVRTRLVSVSHVSRQTGLRLPARELVEIAHKRRVPVLLDGAQAFGAIPTDVRELGCDFYVCSGHKYIMAPHGTGVFYVRQDRLDWLKPSWLGSHSQDEYDESVRVPTHVFNTEEECDRLVAGLRRIVRTGY
jgi:L-cysteine/cystine lyase